MRVDFWFINTIVKLGTSIMCRIDAPDIDKIPNKGPLIAYSNHTGQIEVPLMFAHFQPRPMTGFAKIETWDNWFLHWVFDVWGGIPIRRGEVDMEAMRKALDVLEKGMIFVIAPEGTRNKTGKLIKAHPGIVTLALRSGAPLLPIVHWGGEDFSRNFKRYKRTDFHIRVGEPFKLDTGDERVTREVRQQMVDEMMYRLATMLPEKYRGVYADLENATDKYVSDLPPYHYPNQS